MKKFDRLPPEQRRDEICAAAMELFIQKGFSATTMENIVEQVSLSKGGVYRLYPSTASILSDLMVRGMRMRNRYYEDCAAEQIALGRELTLSALVEMIVDSLLLYPDFSAVYVEFLWEKQHNRELEALYQQICGESIAETMALIQRCGADELLLSDPQTLEQLTDLMNAAILGLRVLNLRDSYQTHKAQICAAILQLLQH